MTWEDLRLTREETGSIALQRRPELPRETLDDIYAKTQGWAAGLVLMLEQGKMRGSFADVPDLSTGQLVFDYLAGEIFEKSDGGTQEFLLREGRHQVGRQDTCAVAVLDRQVSRLHAIVQVTPTGTMVEDQKSANGTFVNGQRISTPTPLQHGDRVTFGGAEFKVEVIG